MTTSPPPSGAEKARLLRHTQAVARLRHPNLVRMLPLPGGAGLSPILGEAHRLSDFTLPAGTFKRFDLEQVVRLLLDVLSGLAALHEVVTDGQVFVHGQVAPHNIYVDEHGTARLVPLLNVHSTSARPEHTGYAAPESLVGATPDVRADVFSVGVMLWEALAGKRLYPDPSPAAVLARRAPPIELAPRTSWAQPLCAIAERAIASEPAQRFQSALDLSNAIAASAAQQLSRVDTDAWQEEAPTPVFQPRLHLSHWRAGTPAPSVLDVPPLPKPASGRVESAPPLVVAAGNDAQALPRPRRGNAWLFVSAALALVVSLSVVGWRQAPRAWHQLATRTLASIAYNRPPAAAAARLELPSVPHAVVEATSAPAPAPSALPRASASAPAATGSAAAPVASAPPRRSTPVKVAPKPRLNDYGIWPFRSGRVSCPTMSLLQLGGRSVAGLETCIEVPSLKLLLDLGCCASTAVRHPQVLLSHGHLDHMGAVAQHAARRALLGMSEGVYFVPEAIASLVEQLFNAAGALDGQVIPRRVVPLSPGREEPLGKGRYLRPFQTFHRVPSQGYTVWETRSRLRAEFRDLPGDKLGELRRRGVDVDERRAVPLLSFTGDTRVEVLERTPELQQTECLVIETSFLDERVPVARAREMGHVHLDELIARRELLPGNDIVFSHFSSRYTPAEVEQLLRQKLPSDLSEIVRTLPMA